MEEEQVQKCVIKWAKNVGYNIQTAQWENMWSKGLKCIICSDLTENFYKMMYSYRAPEKLSRMYKRIPNICWKCKQYEELSMVDIKKS